MSEKEQQTESGSKNEVSMYQLADRFIALANEVAAEQGIDKASSAIRYAAARYSAFEASLKAEDLRALKQDALEWFSKDYQSMLDENLDDHIQRAEQG